MASNAGAIRAGKAYVEALLEDKQLRKGLAAAELRLKAFSKEVSSLGTKMMAVGVAIAAPMVAAAKAWADAGSALVDMSQRTGVSAERLSALSYAAAQSATTIETVELHLRRMSKTVTEAGQGSKSAVESLGRLGFTFNDLKAMTPDQQFKAFADKIDAIQNPTQKVALAMDVFGKSAADLFPLMTGGSAAIGELETRARELGIVMSNEDAAAAEQFGDAIDELGRVAKATANALAVAIVPTLRQVGAELSSSLQQIRGWIEANQELTSGALKGAAAAIALGAAFKGISVVIASVVSVVRVLLAVFSGPAGWIALAIAGVLQLTGVWGRLRDEVKGYFSDLERGRQQKAIEEMTDPVEKYKAQMDAANQRRFEAIDNAAKRPGDKHAQLNVNDATRSYVYYRKKYQEALAEKEAAAAAGNKGDKGGPSEAEAKTEEDRVKKRDEFEAEARENRERADTESIDDKWVRENWQINQKYRKMREEAQSLGAVTTDIDRAEQSEYAAMDARKAKEEKDTADEAAKKQREKDQERADARKEMDREVAKAEIESTMTGRQKDLALLELERQQALEDAQASGVPEESVNRLFGLRARNLTTGLRNNEQVAGTFAADAAGQMGPSTTVDRIATATEQQLTTMNDVQRILRRIEQAGGGIAVR